MRGRREGRAVAVAVLVSNPWYPDLYTKNEFRVSVLRVFISTHQDTFSRAPPPGKVCTALTAAKIYPRAEPHTVGEG